MRGQAPVRSWSWKRVSCFLSFPTCLRKMLHTASDGWCFRAAPASSITWNSALALMQELSRPPLFEQCLGLDLYHTTDVPFHVDGEFLCMLSNTIVDGTHEPHVGHLRGVWNSLATETFSIGFGLGRWRLAHRGVHGLEYQVNQLRICE